ncbi:hypothetical protein [Paracoccus marinaquae]|uniref:Uncharacterized protein n=1 Tax=Paracoccus marinaquae TaxID=2841926 RepID=A0ABS6AKV9_9RHOB|nr:hypothetical protein [Paracoccus marinaquae]MBU3031217.1 hypothetical protein [Paracoccus marinaquae]
MTQTNLEDTLTTLATHLREADRRDQTDALTRLRQLITMAGPTGAVTTKVGADEDDEEDLLLDNVPL